MVLVAAAMVAIIGMAALSIDVVTLYLARVEAQRSADAAALTAARVLSLSGITGDPDNVGGKWTAACDAATQLATAVANQNNVGGAAAATTVNVSFAYNGIDSRNCTYAGGSGQFGVNPQVQVQVIRGGLPTLFLAFGPGIQIASAQPRPQRPSILPLPGQSHRTASSR